MFAKPAAVERFAADVAVGAEIQAAASKTASRNELCFIAQVPS